MKKLNYLIIFLFILIITSEYVYPLAITARRDIDFTPGSVNIYPFCVIPENSYKINMRSGGELGQYVVLSKSSDLITKTTCYTYTVSLPDKLPPGDNSALVIVETTPEYTTGSFAIITSVAHEFRVRVPYVGKYLYTTLSAGDIDVGEVQEFTINAENRGDQTILYITPRIDIYDNTDTLIASLDPNRVSDVEPRESITITQSWNSSGQLPGQYKWVAHLNYDEAYINASALFRIGTMNMSLYNATSMAEPAKINTYYIYVKNEWSDRMNDVYAQVTIHSANFKTQYATFAPFQTGALLGYFDTRDIKEGSYNASVTLHYGDGLSAKGEFPIEVKAQKIDIPFMQNKILLTIVGLVILIIVLIVANIFLLKKAKGDNGLKSSKSQEEEVSNNEKNN